jgi:hypothetical protein
MHLLSHFFDQLSRSESDLPKRILKIGFMADRNGAINGKAQDN